MTTARQATTAVTFVDECCALYHDFFPDVRSFEHFTYLHLGMLSEIKRKTLLALAKVNGDLDPQFLYHFVANTRLVPSSGAAPPPVSQTATPIDRFQEHRWWDSGQDWKNQLNNLRLILQPYVFHWFLLFDIPGLRASFRELISITN